MQPTIQPTIEPSTHPTSLSPTAFPSNQPSSAPSRNPSTSTSGVPSSDPSSLSPTAFPSNLPSSEPSRNPTIEPTYLKLLTTAAATQSGAAEPTSSVLMNWTLESVLIIFLVACMCCLSLICCALVMKGIIARQEQKNTWRQGSAQIEAELQSPPDCPEARESASAGAMGSLAHAQTTDSLYIQCKDSEANFKVPSKVTLGALNEKNFHIQTVGGNVRRHTRSQDQKVQAAPDATWPCTVCTFVNPSDKSKCELCLTPKPDVSVLRAALRRNDDV